jgi:hypothetical protein
MNFETPGEVGPAVTGILAEEAAEADAQEWTAEELADAKPMFLYFFRQGLTDPMNDEYKFSRRFEMGLQEKLIDEINDNWAAKKVGLDLEEEIEESDKATRIELWSAIETKMKVITYSKKDQKLLAAGPMTRVLKKYKKVNDGLVAKEIKRLEKLEKQLEEESAAK